MLLIALATILVQGSTPDTLRPSPLAEVVASAYLDADARELVHRARGRREQVDRSLTSYRVLGKERISVGLRALRRDRMLFRQETAARIHWRRDGVGRVEVLGARQVVPVVGSGPEVDDVPSDAGDLAFDPSDNQLLRGFADDNGDTDVFLHPLAEGSERVYRFQSGDTTRLRLPGGREVRLAELRVLPRPGAPPLLQGSLWFDLDTHAPVRGVFQLSRRVDLQHDLGEDDEDIPGAMKPIVADLRYLTIDYGLWEQRWWLPRLVALEAVAKVGRLASVPVVFERVYGAYEVEGEGTEARIAAAPPADTADGVRKSCHGENRCWRYVTEVAPDSQLLRSEHLPPSIYSDGESMISRREIEELADALGISRRAISPWQRPHVRWSLPRSGMLRYNRVEGLALGARADADFGRLAADASLWLGTADLEPAAEVGITRERFDTRHRLAAYRRLATVAPDRQGVGLGSSLSALLLGRDDHDYYRALGVELAGAPAARRRWEHRWRLYAERQTAADKSTDFSLPRLWDSGRSFRDNIGAAEAEQVGGSLAVGYSRGQDPNGWRWGAELAATAEAGTWEFVRPSASAFVTLPLSRSMVGALEVAGGTALGEVPIQSEWFLGGPASVRGYGGTARIHGPAFWRARAEAATSFPAARLALFSDAGWAGDPRELRFDPPLLSAGVGASFLDGLVRVDLSRALREPQGWRMDLYLDAIL